MLRNACWLSIMITTAFCCEGSAQRPTGPIRGPMGRGPSDAAQIWTALAKKHDADQNGKIEKSEYSRGEAKFNSLDRNEDGVLTEADFSGNVRRGRGATPDATTPQVGDVAPDFNLPFAEKPSETVQLSSFAGKRPVALIFGSYT